MHVLIESPQIVFTESRATGAPPCNAANKPRRRPPLALGFLLVARRSPLVPRLPRVARGDPRRVRPG